MYGDLSRLTFRPGRHFSAVVAQQGRVTLDADVNEQAAVERHYARTLATDLIGPFGGPTSALGFEIDATTVKSGSEEKPSLTIGSGRYYVGGILCELDAPADYFSQPNVYLADGDALAALPDPPYLVYLKVWERYVSDVEDPSLREVALGINGPDTTGRLQVMWQALVHPVSGVKTAQSFYNAWENTIEPEIVGEDTATLMAGVDETIDATDVCVLPSTSGYRGPENQLYRVEIHRGGGMPSSGTTGPPTLATPVMSVPPPSPGFAAAASADESGAADGSDSTPTFKWSRDNGSVCFPIMNLNGKSVTVATLGRDPQLSVEVGNYVQIVDDAYESQGDPGPLTRYAEPLHLVTGVDPVNRIVTLDTAPATKAGSDPSLHPFLRRWDQVQEKVTGAHLTIDPDDSAIQVEEGVWIELELGVQIWFVKGGTYRAGDYWLIPARVATGNVEWPQMPAQGTTPASPALLPPFGVDYRLAPLALALEPAKIVDLRRSFDSLAK